LAQAVFCTAREAPPSFTTMAEAAAPSLGDFFKSKGKKKVKATNLNKETKTEETKKKATTKEDEAWEEEQVQASTMSTQVVGKLVREEEKKEEEDNSAPAWGELKKQAAKEPGDARINDKRYPTLAKSNATSSINIDDGSNDKVTMGGGSKNHFAQLAGNENDSDDEGGVQRPKEIKPAMVSKKQGEFAKVALQREVDKYAVKKVAKKKKVKKEGEEDEEEESEEEEEEAEEPAPEEERKPKKEKKEEKKDDRKANKPAAENAGPVEVAEDLKIQVDLAASKQKYQGRKKMPPAELPREELSEKKTETKKVQDNTGKKKKVFEEETEKKLAYAPF